MPGGDSRQLYSGILAGPGVDPALCGVPAPAAQQRGLLRGEGGRLGGPGAPPGAADGGGGNRSPVVLCVHDSKQAAGGGPGGLCAAGPVKGDGKTAGPVPALPAEHPAVLSQHHGHLRPPHPGGRLYY